ncbi:MAG TPA: hypothetical protein O0X13_03030 [Methanocorpusculum sp.]|nr:hypothetical protein [Methanocorpusculum sp.]
MKWEIKILVCGLPAICRCEYRTADGCCDKAPGPVSTLPDCRQCISISCDSAGDCTIEYSHDVQRFRSVIAVVEELAKGDNL